MTRRETKKTAEAPAHVAESCADHFGVKDEGGPLDDDGHWIWEVALEVVDERTEADDEEECDDF